MRAPRATREQRGSALPFVVAMVGALLTVSVLVAAVGAVVADQRRVEAGADLAALAGAAALQQGRPGCPTAAEVLRRNGARIARCHVAGQVVEVQATRRTGPMLGRSWTTRSTARAGPQQALSSTSRRGLVLGPATGGEVSRH